MPFGTKICKTKLLLSKKMQLIQAYLLPHTPQKSKFKTLKSHTKAYSLKQNIWGFSHPFSNPYLFPVLEVAILKWHRLLPDPKTKWKHSGGAGTRHILRKCFLSNFVMGRQLFKKFQVLKVTLIDCPRFSFMLAAL